ncbi:hypothetical protein L7F22_021713 [Adiantum nelumboides]|nr:hypothetical protein [Adiantum nelumboides]
MDMHSMSWICSNVMSEHNATWEHYLPLVEYAYNNIVHTSIGKAPFELVEGDKKVPPILQTNFQVCDKINDVAYRLKLQVGWKVRIAFHVSLLRPFVGDVPEKLASEEQPEELDEILVPEQILAHKAGSLAIPQNWRYLCVTTSGSDRGVCNLHKFCSALKGVIQAIPPYGRLF